MIDLIWGLSRSLGFLEHVVNTDGSEEIWLGLIWSRSGGGRLEEVENLVEFVMNSFEFLSVVALRRL